MQCYLNDGNPVSIVAPGAMTSGVPYLLNSSLVVVPQTTAASGALVAVMTRGLFSLVKKSGDTPAVGAKLYWDDTNKYITTTSTSNTFVGLCTTAALSADPTVEVLLHGNPV